MMRCKEPDSSERPIFTNFVILAGAHRSVRISSVSQLATRRPYCVDRVREGVEPRRPYSTLEAADKRVARLFTV